MCFCLVRKKTAGTGFGSKGDLKVDWTFGVPYRAPALLRYSTPSSRVLGSSAVYAIHHSPLPLSATLRRPAAALPVAFTALSSTPSSSASAEESAGFLANELTASSASAVSTAGSGSSNGVGLQLLDSTAPSRFASSGHSEVSLRPAARVLNNSAAISGLNSA